MRKKALLIFIVIALFVAGFFLTKAYAETRPWQQNQNARSFQADPNPSSIDTLNNVISDVRPSANPNVSGLWYSPMNPNYRTDYYWYRSPHDDRWSNAVRNWWCR